MVQEKNKFINFLKQQKNTVVVVTLFTLLSYGFKIFFYSNQFDTIQMSVKYSNILGWWTSIGRYALVITKRIFENGFFNIYFSNFLTLIMLVVCVLVWSYTLYANTNEKSIYKGKYWIFGILFVTTPIMVEQISFSLQNWEVMLGYTLTGVAVWAFFKGLTSKRYYFLISIILMTWNLGIYQNFIVIFVLGFLFIMLLRLDMMENHRQIIKVFFIFGISCVISLFFYVITCKVMQNIVGVGASGYLSESIQWFSRPIKESIYAIIDYVKSLIFSNDTPYSSIVYGIMFVIFFLGGVLSRSKYIFWNIIIRLGIILSPFYFALLFGNSMGMRVQTILPLTVALVGWQLILEFHRIKKGLYIVCIIFIGIFSIKNAQIMCQAFYSDYYSYNNDVRLVDQIRSSASESFPENSLENLVFLNRCSSIDTIQNQISLENIGSSIFNITWLNDYDYQSRVADFFNYLGYNTKYWTIEEFNMYCAVKLEDCDKKEYEEYVLYSYNNATLIYFK